MASKTHFGCHCGGLTYVFQVRITNCIIMDNVTVATGSVLQVQNLSAMWISQNHSPPSPNIGATPFAQDCIICDGSSVSGNVKSCIVGRGQEVQGSHENQTILARDRMMEV